ncbi:MAG: hypothetical protein JSS27_03460 [Planctomycetes bacterium]|nr:hypothetical protein [Planctomycetota bacterium]
MNVSLSRFWRDEGGFLISAEAILYASILVIGVISGLSAVREAVVTELADVGQAIANLNQSFQFGGVVGHCAATSGTAFFDTLDFCDSAFMGYPIVNSKCVVICSGTCGFVGCEPAYGYGVAGFNGAFGTAGVATGAVGVSGTAFGAGS